MNNYKNKRILRVNEVAKIFNVEEATVREWAKNKELPAHKVGKSWYFSRASIFERQSVFDAIDLIGGSEGFSVNYDILVDDQRVEIKSSRLSISKRTREYWRFTGFHPAKMSDFYLLLGYNQERTELIYVIKVPSIKLEKRMPVIASKTRHHSVCNLDVDNFDGCSFNIFLKDEFFYPYVIYKKIE